MLCIKFYIILAYVQIVVNFCYTLRLFVQLYFQFLLFCADIVSNSLENSPKKARALIG